MNEDTNQQQKGNGVLSRVSGSLFDETELNKIIHKICSKIGRIELFGHLNGNVGLLYFRGIDKSNERGTITIDYR